MTLIPNRFPAMSWSATTITRVGIAVVAVLLTAGMQLLPATNTSWFANEWLRDNLLRMQAITTPEQRILVVDIDEASLAEIGPWPWPRERVATLLESLLDTYAARGVALDLVFPEAADPAGDLRLSMLAQHAPVVVATAFDYAAIPETPLRIGQLSAGAATATSGGPLARSASGFIANHAGLADAQYSGNIGFIPDADGIIRRLPLLTQFNRRLYPTLSLALLNCCGSKFLLPGQEQPKADLSAQWRIPYQRGWDAYTVASAADIMQGRLPTRDLQGRLALIGSSSLGLVDRVTTPLSASTSGVLVHAAALSAMLDLQAGVAPTRWPGCAIAIGYTLLLAGLAIFTLARRSATTNVLMMGVAALIWFGIAALLAPHDAEVMLTAPLVSILFLLIVAVPFHWQMTQVKSRRLLGTLNQYVAKSVVDELLRSDLTEVLTPVHREVTTLIADLQDYTKHVAGLPVEESAQMTRDFLDCLTRPVIGKAGTLDKYTGDGLVAFWGAPLPDPEHADRALEAAREIVQEVARYNKLRLAAGRAPLRVRIGIESGQAMAGDFGTSFRSIYTAVGDSVNVASRLEQLARNYPYDVIVGPVTASLAKWHTLVTLESVTLRGKDQPIQLYALDVAA